MRATGLTKKIVLSAQIDAYNSAKRRGLGQDDAEQYAQDIFDQIFEAIGGVEYWMDLPPK